MEYRRIILNINDDIQHKYTIDTIGIVRNEDNGKVLKGTSISKQNRYVKIHLDKFYALHRLVALAFIPNPDNLTYINHIDGNRYNNKADNLEWCTQSNNMLHAYNTGLKSNHGELNPFRKLTKEQVTQIWNYKNKGYTARQIRDKLKLSVGIGCVKSILQGKTWTSITSLL